jgi:hypothetical protein
MDRGELIENIAESVLWTVVAASVEKDDQLPVILKDIHYLGDKENLLARTTWCEVFDSDFNMSNHIKDGESLLVSFEMPLILSTWNQEQQLLRITATATGACRIPDIGTYDWENVDFYGMNKQELLGMSKDLVEIVELHYTDVEADEMEAEHGH